LIHIGFSLVLPWNSRDTAETVYCGLGDRDLTLNDKSIAIHK
jgi:hypothetical protein